MPGAQFAGNLLRAQGAAPCLPQELKAPGQEEAPKVLAQELARGPLLRLQEQKDWCQAQEKAEPPQRPHKGCRSGHMDNNEEAKEQELLKPKGLQKKKQAWGPRSNHGNNRAA